MIRSCALLFALMTMIMTITVARSLNTPIVQKSWSTQQCVAVVWGEGTCTDLPRRYEVEWVK